jgi:large subunit ribosomal protein L8e
MHGVMRGQRKYAGSVFEYHAGHRKGALKLFPVEFFQRNRWINVFCKGLGHNGPLSGVHFEDPQPYKARALDG